MVYLLFVFISLVSGDHSSGEPVDSISDLPFDESNHLSSTWILYSGDGCDFGAVASQSLLRIGYISPELFRMFSADEASQSCVAVGLLQGTPRSLIYAILDRNIYLGFEPLEDWLNQFLLKEIGWLSYLPQSLDVIWISHVGDRHKVADLHTGERYTVWLTTSLGHMFEVVDPANGEVVGSMLVEFDAFHVIGQPVRPSPSPSAEEVLRGVESTLQLEYNRSMQIRRTFTSTGFSRGRLPDDLYASMATYYYNNYQQVYIEEWIGMYHINWWETDPLMVGMPWGLKRYWQGRLRPMVEKWIGGVELEDTDIYGIRRYEDGAWLLTHVDREATHAASLIINVDQVDVREPWMVEIYDFSGRLHEIPMEPGDIVYYESARCLHGRMQPLKGRSYSNLFAHYRPVGDPEWFEKENPTVEGNAAAKEECSVSHCIGPDVVDNQFLSPKHEVVEGNDDLFRYWQFVNNIAP